MNFDLFNRQFYTVRLLEAPIVLALEVTHCIRRSHRKYDQGIAMFTKNQGLDHAKEKIRKALVYEYMKRNPGTREQDVVLACKNGKLVFTEISIVLADTELRNQSTQIFKQAASMFSELAIHQDERWNDCVESTHHSLQMIDCLHSSLFECIDDHERMEKEKTIKSLERLCARITVSLYETTKELKNSKAQIASEVTSATRGIVLRYLNTVIDQLNVLHSVLKQEVDLGDLFHEQTRNFVDIQLSRISTKSAAFRIEDISKMYKALKGDKRASIDIAMDFNRRILLSTQKTLGQAVDDLTKSLSQRRKKIQEIWVTISQLQQTAKQIEGIQILEKEGKLPPIRDLNTSPLSRMVRFLNQLIQ